MYLLLISVLSILFHQGHGAIQATADLRFDSTANSIGILTFVQQDANSPVVITGTLRSLNASSNHGFHVHANPVDATTPNCTAAGAHFNPYNTVHGAPTDPITRRHVGDLGNITTDATGTVVVNIYDIIIQFYNSTQNITNLAVVVHLYFDDGGLGNATSNTTGNAGPRIACGLIRIASDAQQFQVPLLVLFFSMSINLIAFLH